MCEAHALIFNNELGSRKSLLSSYILEALLLVLLTTPYFAIIFGPVNTSISSTENATIQLHATRAGYNVTLAHHHTRHLMPHRSYQCVWTLTRIDSLLTSDHTIDQQHITSLLQQKCSLQPTITSRHILLDLPLDPVDSNTITTTCLEQPVTTRDTGEQVGPLSPTYRSTTIVPYDRWLIRNHKPFWIPTRAFARAIGFPDSFHLYHHTAEAITSLAHSTSPVTAGLAISAAFLLIGINLFTSPISPLLQVILRAAPHLIVPTIPPRCQLQIIGTTHELTRLILHSTQTHAAEIAFFLVKQGITSLHTLIKNRTQLHTHTASHIHLREPLKSILQQAEPLHNSNLSPTHHPTPNYIIPTHIQPTFLRLSHAQQSQFIRYISPLLSPLHALLENLPHAYHAAINLLRDTPQAEAPSALFTALNIAAIQDSAGKIILFLTPPFTSIEILDRTLCIMLLQATSTSSFRSTRAARIASRSLLGRF